MYLARVPPTVNYVQYLATSSTLTAVGFFQLPFPQSELSPRFHWDPTVSTDCFRRLLKRTCSLDTSAFSALEVLDDNRALQIY